MTSMGSRLYLTVLCILFISGCHIGSSYHEADNMWHLGYSDVQLNENVYRVSYAGYQIPQNECDEFALMRASEIAKDKGYRYFRILNEQQSASSQAFYMPGSTQTSGTISRYGNFAQMNATSYASGFMATVNYPVSTLMIELLRNRPEASDVLDAEIVWKSLANKHGVGR